MSKRKYTHIAELEGTIQATRESGATQQTVNLVLDTIRLAMKQEKKRGAAELQLHSDALRRLCQDVETLMTIPWRKVSSLS